MPLDYAGSIRNVVEAIESTRMVPLWSICYAGSLLFRYNSFRWNCDESCPLLSIDYSGSQFAGPRLPFGQSLNLFISARLPSGAWTFSNVDLNMATCAKKKQFYKKLDALKASSKGKESKTTSFISDDFYDNAKIWLGQDKGSLKSMSKKDIATVKRKQWTLYQGKIQDKSGRSVVPKRELFKILTDAHSVTAHCGRDKTEHYVREHYS